MDDEQQRTVAWLEEADRFGVQCALPLRYLRMEALAAGITVGDLAYGLQALGLRRTWEGDTEDWYIHPAGGHHLTWETLPGEPGYKPGAANLPA